MLYYLKMHFQNGVYQILIARYDRCVRDAKSKRMIANLNAAGIEDTLYSDKA